MDTKQYKKIWDQLQPEMTDLLSGIARCVKTSMGIDPIAEPLAGGDEEFKLSQDWAIPGKEESIVGVDIVLGDAHVRGNDEPGLSIMLAMQGFGGEHIATYIPENYSSGLFTLDVEELKSRLNNMKADDTEFGEMICQHLNEFKETRRQGMRP